MSIKQNGGVFGRNPTFNDVTIEGQLTFDGDIDINSDLKVSGDLDVIGNGVIEGDLTLKSNKDLLFLATNPNSGSPFQYGEIRFGDSNSGQYVNHAFIKSSGTYASNSTLDFHTSNSNSSPLRMQIAENGNVNVSTGNLVIGTSGKGIDFSATAGTGTSELLDDYEEGYWTPAFSGGDYSFTYNKQKGSYTKIGNRVYVDMVLYIHPSTAPSGTVDGNLSVTGLPYAFNKQNDVESVGGIVTFKQLFLSSTETVATRLSDTGTSFLLYSTLATNYPDSGFAQASNVGANARIRIQFSYPTNG